MKYDVFISCKSEDYNIGRQVYEFLINHRELNLNVFMADKELRKLGESDYGDAIDEALDSSSHLIVVSSNVDFLKKKTSPYVYYEWHTFAEEVRNGRKDGNMMTILTDTVKKKDLPLALRNCQSFPVTEYSSIITYLAKEDLPEIGRQIVKPSIVASCSNDGDEDLDYEDALEFIETGRLQDAIHSLLYSFENGNQQTISLFNKVLFQNFGKTDWNEKTWKFFEEQANKGYSFAYLAFFYKYYQDKSTYSQARKCVTYAKRDKSNGYAILCDGIIYEKGIGEKPDLIIATNRYKKAIEKKTWEACSYLAEMHLKGTSNATISKEEAINVLLQGQEHGDARSWYVLGSIYKRNAYIKENWEKAVESYQKAVELHLYDAWIELGNLYNFNRFSNDYKDEALSCYLEALKNGNKDAHAYIALQYWDKDRQEDAIIEAKKGEKAGNVLSISSLGKFYEQGILEEGQWIKEYKPDYPKAWEYYSKAFEIGGRIEDAISMARLYVKDEYRPQNITWDTIEGYLEQGSQVPIIESLELMIEALRENNKESEIIKYLKIGAESGSLSMKHEYGIRLLSTDNGTALALIEEAGEKKYQPSVKWLLNYYKSRQTGSEKNYEKWMEIAVDMNMEVPIDDYIQFLIKSNNPEKARRYLLDKYSGENVEFLIWIYRYYKSLDFDKDWLLAEFKSNYKRNKGKLSNKEYANFLLENKCKDVFDSFLNDITRINEDEGRYYSLLRETFETNTIQKDLAQKIIDFSKDKSITDEMRNRSNELLHQYVFNKRKTKILVVDSKSSNILLLKILLTNEHFQVCTANSGNDCLEVVNKEKPDLVLLDVMLPDISGFDIVKKLKRNIETKDIPIVFLTALNNPTDLVFGFQVGAEDFITKPFNKEELIARIMNPIIQRNLSKIIDDVPRIDEIRGDKILIVDDVVSNVLCVKILLTNEHFNVVTANCGYMCIEQARKEQPDIILLDVMMPDISGFDAAVILKKDPDTQDIPIMFLTALNSPKDLVHGFQVGGSEFLTKPFNKEELVMRIKQILKTRRLIRSFLSLG